MEGWGQKSKNLKKGRGKITAEKMGAKKAVFAR